MLTVLWSLLFLLSLSDAAPAPKSIWSIDIWKGPAPSPEDGPPAAANSLRDPSKTKYQAIGVVCAAISWIAVTGIAVYIVKRRQKRSEEAAYQPQEMETMKPTGQITFREIEAPLKSPTSVKSPGKMSSIKSWARGRKNSETSLSTQHSRIDERVLQYDKAKNMDDMAKLYAAVMAHDQERASQKAHSSADSSPILEDEMPPTPKTPLSPRTPRTPRSPRSPTIPAGLAHPAYVPPIPQEYYSQDHYAQDHYEPMPPPIAESDESSLISEGHSPHRKVKPTALSFVSNTTSRLGSSHSSRSRPNPITVRGQPISKPLGSADLTRSAAPSLPTSPRQNIYSPGPPPPTPGRNPALTGEEIEMHGRPQLTSLNSQERVNDGSKALPFRQFYKDSLRSAPATKTTFLDRRTSVVGGGPKTGVPRTPYSPYCPQTPMTPVTPRRLLNKQEIKQNKKQYAMDVLKENEMVQDDNEMWGN